MATRDVDLPKKVWVGAYEFPMDMVLPDHEELVGLNGMCMCDHDNHYILIAASLDNRKLLEIVKHEIVHAINWVYEIDSGAKEERIAEKHGEAWAALYLDNPAYLRWLTYITRQIRKERTDA